MTKGVVDVYVSEELDENHIVLTVNCSEGLPNDLHLIEDGSTLTLLHDNKNIEVTATHEKPMECSFNYMEVDSSTAEELNLLEGERYVLTSDPTDPSKIRMKRLNSIQAYGLMKTDPGTNRDNSVTIGYTLLSWLGIPDTRNTYITFGRGTAAKRLKVISPENALDTDIRLTPANMRFFNLIPGKRAKLRFNRSTNTLDVLTKYAPIDTQRIKRQRITETALIQKKEALRKQVYKTIPEVHQLIKQRRRGTGSLPAIRGPRRSNVLLTNSKAVWKP